MEEYIEILMYELELYKEKSKQAEIQKQLNGRTITGELPVSI